MTGSNPKYKLYNEVISFLLISIQFYPFCFNHPPFSTNSRLLHKNNVYFTVFSFSWPVASSDSEFLCAVRVNQSASCSITVLRLRFEATCFCPLWRLLLRPRPFVSSFPKNRFNKRVRDAFIHAPLFALKTLSGLWFRTGKTNHFWCSW